MIRVKIGLLDYELSKVREDWLAREINGHKNDGTPICIQVVIQTGALDFMLSTPACSGGSGSRPPTPQESEILKHWNQQRLNKVDFSCHNVIAFLKQLASLV